MGNERETISSCLAGFGVFVFGIFVDPLMMALGALIVCTGILANIVEKRRIRFQIMQVEEKEKKEVAVREKTA